MGKRKGIVSPAPALIAEGSSSWHEYTVRREMPDGRVVDSDPMTEGSASVALSFVQFVLPPATRVSVRRRLVSVFASPWEEVKPADDDVSVEDALAAGESVPDARTAEDLSPARAVLPTSPGDDVSGDAEFEVALERRRLQVAEWWVPVDSAGREILKRLPYREGSVWRAGSEADRIRAMGFAETANGPLILTVPVDAAVTPGDGVSVAGPELGGEVSPMRVDRPDVASFTEGEPRL